MDAIEKLASGCCWKDVILDGFKGNHGFYHEIWGVPVTRPVNQSKGKGKGGKNIKNKMGRQSKNSSREREQEYKFC